MIAARERPGFQKEVVAPGAPPEVVERDDVEVPGATRCPWCHDRVVAGTAWCACEGCLARVHVACWADAGRCPTCAARTCLSSAPGETSLVMRQTITVAGGALGLGAGLMPAFLAALAAGCAVDGVSRALAVPAAWMAGLAVGGAFTATGAWLAWRVGERHA